MKSGCLCSILYISGLLIILTYGCGQSEYQSAAGECCPMCSMGQIVLRDCAGDFSTTCKPCYSGTFMNQPNGLTTCFQCKVCDQACTIMRDAVCGVLDGYYCPSKKNQECTIALKHRQCDPGEEIKAPGTKDSDTVCQACPLGYYSLLGINCTKWTDCSVKGEIKVKEGSSVEDVQCIVKTSRGRGLIGVPVFLVLSFMIVLCSVYRERENLKIPVEETVPHCSTSNSPEENKEEDFTPPCSGLP